MDKYKKYISHHWFGISVAIILLIATALRFNNYSERWGLAYDQARDVLVAREALKTSSLPLIGPFASAGQFVYGPQWFWILMYMVSVYPYAVMTPWIIQTLLYVGIVWLMVLIGREIEGKRLGLIIGILTAISTAQLGQSTNLSSPSMVGIVSAASLYFFVKYVKAGSVASAFWMSFMIATAFNIHFQAMGLFLLIPISFILNSSRNFKKFLYLLLGVLVPFIPLIFFDITNKFFESKNWFEYLTYGQYQIFIPNRWLTYAGTYWPGAWSRIIGGEVYVGYGIIVLLIAFAIYAFISKKLTKNIIAIFLSFFFIFLMLRYYRGERFDSYLVFLHPLVLILTGWMISQAFKLNRVVGFILISIIVVLTIKSDFNLIKNSGNFTRIQAADWQKLLIEKFPNSKFAVYDYGYKLGNKSFPLVLYLENSHLIDDKGMKVGLVVRTSKMTAMTDFHSVVGGDRGGYEIFNLNSSTSAELSKEGWAFVNPSQIYTSTVLWYKK
ncbi:MAG: hypothetical protein Q7R31_02630 [Candidatus Levybacteria bacterium]|nr:hypothetical protein [Candidatus Levybacteria bacterium]